MEDLGSNWKFGSCVKFRVLFLWLKGMDWLEKAIDFRYLGCLVYIAMILYALLCFLIRWAGRDFLANADLGSKYPVCQLNIMTWPATFFGILCLTGLSYCSVLCIEKTAVGSDMPVLFLAWDVNQLWSYSINVTVWFFPRLFPKSFFQKCRILSQLPL